MYPIVLTDVLEAVTFERYYKEVRGYTFKEAKMGLGDKLFGAFTPPLLRKVLVSKASEAVGRELACNISFVRLNHSGTDSSPRIHADHFAMNKVDVAAVFYFETSEHGTALFEHDVLGRTCKPGAQHVFKDTEGWKPYHFYAAIANSMLLYSADMFHSRWPVKSYGDSAKDGRIIVVNFMHFKESK